VKKLEVIGENNNSIGIADIYFMWKFDSVTFFHKVAKQLTNSTYDLNALPLLHAAALDKGTCFRSG
jgi:hypothetical protein